MSTAGLILAAGRSSRMGSDKALLDFRGRPFLSHLAHLLLPRVDSLVVVLGHREQRIREALPASSRIRVAVNRDYDRGMLTSLQCGLAQVGQQVDAVLWMLVDHPAVRGRTLDRLLAAAANSRAPLVIPRHRGERGHPVVLSKRVIGDLLELDPSRSPQDVVRGYYREAHFFDTDDKGVVLDIDRPEDYRGLVAPAQAQ
ncbi:MAG: nucleotidyltransferase family protein [Bryobacterales bacterium]|nr:nucleotidyltransferase family protein [Bryobacterales bacterium]